MAQARKFAVAATLPNGEALIAGGEGSLGSEESIELYKPSEGKFTIASGSKLTSGRVAARAVTLANGEVFVVGGEHTATQPIMPTIIITETRSLLTSELLAPLANGLNIKAGPSFEATGGVGPAVAPVSDGDVLVAGVFLRKGTQ